MLGLLLVGCTSRPSVHESFARGGYELYDVLPSEPPHAETVALVRRALPIWELSSSERDLAIASFLELHVGSWGFWDRVYRVRSEYLYVIGELRRAGLPEVLAALPYQASRFERRMDERCAGGPWMFPLNTPGLAVGSCRISGDQAVWSTGDPRPVLDQGACVLLDCGLDERNDLAASTRVAISGLRETHLANGGDLLATLAAHARSAPEAVVAQHLAAACAFASVEPGAFSQVNLAYCGEVSVPGLAEVNQVMGPRGRPGR